ncbi:RulA protein [Pseudomonas sp. FW300-N1A1]|uniref:LexA family protein n=1 Tax=Pseudomonas sp. FW300-N1A1 TaxID=2075555 RepID=UPI000CCFEC99|nr:S24 family peptidase [Pseudomonas sp. FW300-N1A1]POA21249.1 RulA protein [Pseudomonas sp. FW300-N1A1]
MSLTILASRQRLQLPDSGELSISTLHCAAQEQAHCDFSLDRIVGLGAEQVRAVLVDDDSLLGFGIYPGDRLIVDRSIQPVQDQYVVAHLDSENDYCVRLLAADPKGGLLLKAARPSIPSVPFDELDPAPIWGVVLWVVSYVGRG